MLPTVWRLESESKTCWWNGLSKPKKLLESFVYVFLKIHMWYTGKFLNEHKKSRIIILLLKIN